MSQWALENRSEAPNYPPGTQEVANLPVTSPEEFYHRLMAFFLEKKYHRPFQVFIVDKPLRLVHSALPAEFCKETDFLKCMKITKNLLERQREKQEAFSEDGYSSQLKSGQDSRNEVGESKGSLDNLRQAEPLGRLKKMSNFHYLEEEKKIIYRRLLQFGWLLNQSGAISEFSISESDLADEELTWILHRFLQNYGIAVLKLENNKMVELEASGKFFDQLIGLKLTHLSLDRTNLHRCNLSALSKLYVVRISMKFCSLEDEDIKLFCEPLATNGSLRNLNLNFNKIGDLGCKYLAVGLRMNRALSCLSLMHNIVGNAGLIHLISILKSFQLTRPEILKIRKIKLDKYLATLDENGQSRPETLKSKGFDDSVKGDTKKPKSVSGKSKGGIKEARSKDSGDARLDVQDYDCDQPRKLQIGQSDDSEGHGRKREVADTCKLHAGMVYSDGNFHLTHLYLSHNKLTPPVVSDVLDLLNYQQNLKVPPGLGLVALTIHNELIHLNLAKLKKMLAAPPESINV